jgi:hypothetical protein
MQVHLLERSDRSGFVRKAQVSALLDLFRPIGRAFPFATQYDSPALPYAQIPSMPLQW